MRATIAIARRDLLLELRRREAVPAMTLMPSAHASEPAQLQIMSLAQRKRSCARATAGSASRAAVAPGSSP